MIPVVIDKIVKKFGAVTALQGVTLRIEPGELFFLLGPSGCGKTTLLRTIAGFYMPDEGRILFGDTDVTRLPPHKRNTGMMFQSYALWPHLSVEKNVAFGLEERRLRSLEIRKRVYEALAAVKMESFASRRIAQLSGGQQQRVALARALVIRPKCLLLDEPLSSIDARLRLEMRSEIRRVCKEAGLTAIYVTHDQKEALSISDRIAILEGGKIAQTGTPEQIYRRPHTKVVADFIGETNFLYGRIVSVSPVCVDVETTWGHFQGVCGDPDWKPQPGGHVVLSIRPECWKFSPESCLVNSVSGRIGDATYLGEVSQYRFALPGLDLKIYELNPDPSARPPGRELHAVVERNDVVLIKP